MEKIVTTTVHEEDVPWNSYLYFTQYRARLVGADSAISTDTYDRFIANLQLPLQEWVKDHTKETIPILLQEELASDHRSFISLHAFIAQLGEINTSTLDQETASILANLAQYYRNVIAKLCALSIAERSDYLTDWARMNVERTGKSYLISQTKARQLLNRPNICEYYDVTSGRKDGGESSVHNEGGVFFKNPKFSGINPGIEWAMYSFSELLSQQGITPSALVVLQDINVKSFVASNDVACSATNSTHRCEIATTHRECAVRQCSRQGNVRWCYL